MHVLPAFSFCPVNADQTFPVYLVSNSVANLAALIWQHGHVKGRLNLYQFAPQKANSTTLICMCALCNYYYANKSGGASNPVTHLKYLYGSKNHFYSVAHKANTWYPWPDHLAGFMSLNLLSNFTQVIE